MNPTHTSLPDALSTVAGTTVVLLDGFPRTIEQSTKLVNAFGIDAFILLSADGETGDDELVARASGRGMDPVTGAIYNNAVLPSLDLAPPAGIATEVRPKDKDETAFRRRLEAWQGYIGQVRVD